MAPNALQFVPGPENGVNSYVSRVALLWTNKSFDLHKIRII